MDSESGEGDAVNNVTSIKDYAQFRSGSSDQTELFGAAAGLWIEDGEWLEADIPRRAWIAPGYLMRGAVTVLSGPGSAGKSMLTVLWCVAMALDKRIGRFSPRPGCRSLIYNVEDDALEQRRRLSAALRQFHASPSDLTGRVIRVGPSGVGTLLRLDPFTKRLTATPNLTELRALIVTHQPDVVFLDPMVEMHDSEENDNTAIRGVMAELRKIAAEYACAICILHHARKGVVGAPGDPDSLRGASAIVGAARVVLTVLTMDQAEAEKLGVLKRRDYFRVDGAKQNYAPIEEAEWFRRGVYTLENGEDVAAALPWIPPSVMKDMPIDSLNAALDSIHRGLGDGVLYSSHKRGRSNERWVGRVLIDMLNVNEAQAADIVKKWLQSGLLVETTFRDPTKREDRTGVTVADEKRPT